MSDVSMTLSHPYNGKQTGDKITVSGDEARNLIAGGIATVTKAEAKKVEQHPVTATPAKSAGDSA